MRQKEGVDTLWLFHLISGEYIFARLTKVDVV